ncbi:MAG TPA: hypothetical protein VEA59_06390 [Patescibacteria group bacterium]|nr:hypothetical protein [Patescibacteria group bacterium]
MLGLFACLLFFSPLVHTGVFCYYHVHKGFSIDPNPKLYGGGLTVIKVAIFILILLIFVASHLFRKKEYKCELCGNPCGGNDPDRRSWKRDWAANEHPVFGVVSGKFTAHVECVNGRSRHALA